MIKVPSKVADRLAAEISKYQKVLTAAKDRDVNESDTVTIIVDMLSEVFGFDKYSEVTSEQAIRGTFCDLAIKLDGKIQYLIEVKAVGLGLKENHLRQALGYGAGNGVPWIVLTNGLDWEIHRVKFEQPVSHELVCAFNLAELKPKKEEDQAKLFLLCKEGLVKSAIDDFHDHIQSVNRFVIGAIILSEPVIAVIKREVKRVAAGGKVTDEEVSSIIRGEVLKRDIVDSDAATDAVKLVKKAQKQKLRNVGGDEADDPAGGVIDQPLPEGA